MSLFGDIFDAALDIGGALAGAYLGASATPKPQKVEQAAPAPKAQKTAPGLDPKQGAGISAKKRAIIANRGKAGRSNLRIDLVGDDTDDSGRTGLRIQ